MLSNIFFLCFLLPSFTLATTIIQLNASSIDGGGNEDVEVYRDSNCIIKFHQDIETKRIKWITSLYSKGWTYMKKNYGYFGGGPENGRLVGVFHSDCAEGYMGMGKGSWAENGGSNYVLMAISPNSLRANNMYDKSPGSLVPKQDILWPAQLHYISNVVQEGNNRIYGSPVQSIRDDNGFQDTFIYDFLLGMPGYSKLAEEWMKKRLDEEEARANQANVDGASVGDVKPLLWFKDFWLPTYKKYGKGKIFARFYELLADYWPKENRGSLDAPPGYSKYTKEMNLGEFVHFLSGAVKKNLSGTAMRCVRWNSKRDDSEEYEQARKEYPDIKY